MPASHDVAIPGPAALLTTLWIGLFDRWRRNRPPQGQLVDAYDPIGNRTEYTEGTANPLYYCANALNQYTYTDDESDTCPSPPTPTESFSHDADGNLSEDGSFTYTCDAENRLIGVAPNKDPNELTGADRKVECRYDYLGRRVEKAVYAWDPNAAEWCGEAETIRRFVYTNWLLLLELDATDPEDVTILRKYTWGLDLAGQAGSINSIDSAGGIGGLLATEDVESSKKYIYFHDANGNVGQLLDRSDGSADAKYEYDAYGNVVASGGDYADDNPFRFSTKYWDDETGLGNWGRRYYSPRLGRWISRDPVAEFAGANLQTFVGNHPRNGVDSVGLCTRQPDVIRKPEPFNDISKLRAARFLLRYLVGYAPYVQNLSRADGAGILSHTPAVMFALGGALTGAANQAKDIQLCNSTKTYNYTFNPTGGTAGGNWYYVIGTYLWWGHARCSASKKCWCCSDCSEAYSILVECRFSFHGSDYYNYGPSGPTDAGVEDVLFGTTLLYFSWNPDARLRRECLCNDRFDRVRLEHGAGGAW